MVNAWYCTREDVKTVLDVNESVTADYQVDRACESATEQIRREYHRRFLPYVATKYFDFPDYSDAESWKLYLNDDDLISASALASGGVSIAASDYNLEPNRAGPPYTRLEIKLSSDAAFGGGATPQRDITVTGTWGYCLDSLATGALNGAINNAVTTVLVTSGARIGVGSLLVCDSEYMVVTDRGWVDTTQDLQSDMTALRNMQTVAVTDGTKFAVGEEILLDAERMLVTSVAGNNLLVQRGYEGTTLSTHSSSSVYASRSLTVERSAHGSTAAAHLDAAPLSVLLAPAPVRSLAIAEAVNIILQEQAGYARTVGTGETIRNASGAGLADLRQAVCEGYGRKMRFRTV